MKRSNRRFAARIVLALLLLSGCATAGAGGDDDDDVAGGPDADVSIEPDGAPGQPDAAPAVACDLVTQTGCPGGKACDLGDTNQTECRDVTGNPPGTEINTCAGETTCASGYVCIGDGPGKTSCMRYCGVDADCGGGVGALCVIDVIDGMQMPIPGARLCTQACNPVDNVGCPTTWGCHIYQEAAPPMRTLTACDPPGAGGQNATCTGSNTCQAGFDCYMVTQAGVTSNKCLKNCNATANVGCAGVAGTICQGTGAVLGGSEYGACL